MTAKTELEHLDDIHAGFSILEGNLRSAITDIKNKQRTLELIILGKGVKEAFPEAVMLKVAIRDGVAVPLQLLGQPGKTVEGELVPRREVLAWGKSLEKLDVEGWLLDELLDEVSRDGDGSWINLVDALPDIDYDVEDPNRAPKTDFCILLSRAAALPVPDLRTLTIPADHVSGTEVPGTGPLSRLRHGLKTLFPEAYMLYLRRRKNEWEVEELVDDTGLVLRSSEPLAAEAVPGGSVGGFVAQIPVESMVELLTGSPDEELNRPGAVLGMLVDPGRR